MRVDPANAVAERGLNLRVACHHEIDELAHPGFPRAWRRVARDDKVSQELKRCIFVGREKQGRVGARE